MKQCSIPAIRCCEVLFCNFKVRRNWEKSRNLLLALLIFLITQQIFLDSCWDFTNSWILLYQYTGIIINSPFLQLQNYNYLQTVNLFQFLLRSKSFRYCVGVVSCNSLLLLYTCCSINCTNCFSAAYFVTLLTIYSTVL